MASESCSVDDILLELDLNDKEKPKQTIQNCVTALTRDPLLKDAIRKNELTGRIDVVKNLGWKRNAGSCFTDTDMNHILNRLESLYSLTNEKKIREAMDIVASEARYHPIREFLESLVWDGKERIRYAMSKYLGADEDPYTEEVMRLLLRAGIHRVYHPGCKFEIMACLVGDQGVGKSSFFRLLAVKDEWFSDDLKKLDDEMVYRKLQGHWIIEMSEMLATISARSIEDIKSFLSRQKETYKIPYETHPEDRPRQCIFVGTSNNIDFLPLDRTGNRRFAPVQVHPDRIEKHILEDEAEAREYFLQVWAEAMQNYQNEERLELRLPKEQEDYLMEMQKQFMPEDINAGIIQAWLDECDEDIVCTRMIFDEALGREDEKIRFGETKEINKIMNQVIKGWSPVSSYRFGKKYGTQRGWKRMNKGDGFREAKPGEELPFK